ncbi:D-arabinono-1,4-lactone oxidase [Falsarthrobacter nasiphocae]|uniref:FAD-linked oxidoreductase n=1 Tax=Falsarthrobacter nasiphocae TaxID=189863 RepID=A0AAE3YE36_9MICC|nr:D-arabinono-1,4-lactone oxidase [Falsarthrobacter nasiphocae]MDR6891704.1 FAD-linked oxidoreductase [Falsarthrobacter nasiphocae]
MTREGISPRGTWSNWAGNHTRTPAAVEYPETLSGVVTALERARSAGRRFKVVGGSHSFSDIAAGDGVVASLDNYSGLVSADRSTGLAVFRAGTRLRDVHPLLDPHGLALPNMGDVDHQSLAGALSTSTHGTGLAYTGYGASVRALTIVLASGEVVECSPTSRPELFEAARVGLGALGVVVEVTIQCVPRFALRAEEKPEPLDDVIESFTERCEREDHLEFYWFPGTRTALTKTNTRLPWGVERSPVSWASRLIDDELVKNGVYGLTCRAGARFNGLVPLVNRAANRLVSARTYTDASQKVFVSSRRVRFRETEYALPFETAAEALREIVRVVDSFGEAISFPLEVRATAADDVWMSTSTGRRSVYIAAHRYVREPHEAYFAALERVFWDFGGRPHWGKIHSLDAERLRPLYPRFDNFLEQRALADPDGLFLNPYLERVLGV